MKGEHPIAYTSCGPGTGDPWFSPLFPPERSHPKREMGNDLLVAEDRGATLCGGPFKGILFYLGYTRGIP